MASTARRRRKHQASATEEKHPGLARGTTEGGDEFLVPHTINTFESIAYPKNWCAASVLTVSLALFHVWLALFGGMTVPFHICLFFFWRFNYNVVLGLILNKQSNHRTVTRLYKWAKANQSSSKLHGYTWKLLKHLAGSGVKGGHSPDEYPAEFNAWLSFRHLVDLILVNDSCNYLLLGYKCFYFPGLSAMHWYDWLCYAAGLFLAYFNYTAKVDAHRCIGDYSWYWGDFFFRKHSELTFDGIFELFPHPMYTVGYSLYYGYSLICRSYTLLFVSMAAHILQMGFLMWVEEPHIQRTYGSNKPAMDKSEYRFMYDPKSGLFPGKNESIFVTSLDAFYAGDISLVALLGYSTVFSLTMDMHWVVLQVIAWRLFHWLGLGYVLWAQSRRQLYTRHFTDRGRTLYEAFDNWKKTYNMSVTMNAAVFAGCALRFGLLTYPTLDSVLTTSSLACILVGCVLCGLSLWTLASIYEHIGDFGWFWGDFFIPAEHHKRKLSYTGVFRFLNNPDCVVGYAGLYGLALMAQNWTVFWLAAMGQIMNVIFVAVVEIPHTERLYKDELRDKGPLSRKFSEKLGGVIPTPVEKQIKRDAKHIRQKTMLQLYKLYLRAAKVRDRVKKTIKKLPRPGSPSPAASGGESDTEAITLDVSRHIRLGQNITVNYTTTPGHSDTDWIGVYPAEVESAPGQSGGSWIYVPKAESGSVTFDYPLIPRTGGVYEVRYHKNNSYRVECAVPLCLHDCDTDEEEELQHQMEGHSDDECQILVDRS